MSSRLGPPLTYFIKMCKTGIQIPLSKYTFKSREQGMSQWWVRSPPTNVSRVQFRPGAMICGSSLLLVLVLALRVFLQVLRFSSLHKNQYSKFKFSLGACTGVKGLMSSWALLCNMVKNTFCWKVSNVTFWQRRALAMSAFASYCFSNMPVN